MWLSSVRYVFFRKPIHPCHLFRAPLVSSLHVYNMSTIPTILDDTPLEDAKAKWVGLRRLVYRDQHGRERASDIILDRTFMMLIML
jgi:hypothetical protein